MGVRQWRDEQINAVAAVRIVKDIQPGAARQVGQVWTEWVEAPDNATLGGHDSELVAQIGGETISGIAGNAAKSWLQCVPLAMNWESAPEINKRE